MTGTFQPSSSRRVLSKSTVERRQRESSVTKHRVNLASLPQRHNFASFGTVELRAGTGLLEYRGNLISGSVSESSQVMLLPLA